MKRASLILLCFSLFFSACKSLPVENIEEVKAEKPKKVNFPGYEVDLVKKEVRMKAKVCLSNGILEYLACLPNSFEHEAIFVTNGKPELLHAALLMIGRNPKQLYKLGELWWQTIPKFPDCRLNVDVEWQEKGKLRRVPLHTFLQKRTKKSKASENYWVFNGSFFFEKQYVANLDKTVISITPQSSSVIQYGIWTDDPYTGDNYGFEINSKLCPPYGTAINLVFSAYKKSK